MAQLFANNAYGVLASSITSSATSIPLLTGNGARFPSPSGGDFFLATLIGYDSNGNENAWEIVKITGRSSDTLTAVRAQEGTTGVGWASASRIELRMTAATFNDLNVATLTTSGKIKPRASELAVSALGSISGTNTLDLATAGEFTATISNNTTFAFSNAPGANQSQIVILRLTNPGAYTLTWPASTKFNGGSLGTLTASGIDLLGVKYDATTSTYMVFVIAKDVK